MFAKTFSSLFLAASLAACSAPDEPSKADETAALYNTTLTNKELMALIIEPASDILWDSGGWVLDASGYEELYPTTDAGWAYVRAQAAIVVEAGNMLALPGRAEDNDAWMIYSQGLAMLPYVPWMPQLPRTKKNFSKLALNSIASAPPVIRLTIPTS